MRGKARSRGLMSRRAALQRFGVAGVGAAGVALVGCGDGEETALDQDAAEEAAVVPEPEAVEEGDDAPANADDGREAPTAVDVEPADEPERDTAEMPAAGAAARGWREVAVAGERPVPRSNAVLAIDEASGTLWLHGGRAGGEALSDLWAFDLAAGAWREVSAAGGPEARFGHAGVFDGAGRLVVFAGQGAGASRFFSDAWAYDSGAGGWSVLAAEGSGPVSRYGLGVGHDPAADGMWISHGFTHQGRFDDTWILDLDAGVWRDVSPTGERPVRRCLHACAYAPSAGVFALFGGQTNGVPQLGDTWLLVDGSWREVEGAGPSARRFTSLQEMGGSFWLFGGVGADGPSGELWTLGTEGGWSRMEEPGAPGARHSHAAAADGSGGVLYVFGGRDASAERNDLWAYRV